MQTIELDDTNDIFIDKDKNLSLCQDLNAVKQVINCATKTNFGEIVLNTSLGIPYFQTIFIAHPDIELWKLYMIDTILKIDKIKGIQNFNIKIEKAILKYVIIIDTEYGEGVING